MRLNERIRRWRESRGLSVNALALGVGVTPAAVYQWEHKEKGTEPTHHNVEAIAKALGISLSVFWGAVPHSRKRAA